MSDLSKKLEPGSKKPGSKKPGSKKPGSEKEKRTVKAFKTTMAAVSKEEAAEGARERRHDDLTGEYVPGSETPGDPSKRGGGKKRRKSRSKKRRKSRRKRRKSRRKRRKSRRVKKRR